MAADDEIDEILWGIRRQLTEREAELDRNVRNIISTSPVTAEAMAAALSDMSLVSYEELRFVARKLLCKAVMEPDLSPVVADAIHLVCKSGSRLRFSIHPTKTRDLRTTMIDCVENVFSTMPPSEDSFVYRWEKSYYIDEDVTGLTTRRKHRVFSLFHFIGHFYLRDLIASLALIWIIGDLSAKHRGDYGIECCCKLLKMIWPKVLKAFVEGEPMEDILKKDIGSLREWQMNLLPSGQFVLSDSIRSLIQETLAGLDFGIERASVTSSSSPAHAAPSVIEWQYEGRDEWYAFDSVASLELEKQYVDWHANQQGHDGAVEVTSGRYCYRVDLDAMTQTNIQHPGHKVRCVRRTTVSANDCKAHLAHQLQKQTQQLQDEQASKHMAVQENINLKELLDSEVVARIAILSAGPLPEPGTELGVESPSYRFVEKLVLKSISKHRASLHSQEWRPAPVIEVLGVHDICNIEVLEAYKLSRQRISAQCPNGCLPISGICAPQLHVAGPRLNEHLLFHGCTSQAVEQISRAGFDPQRGGEAVGSMFGIGTYFAELASKSDFYAARDNTGVKTLILARVLLGNSYRAKTRMPKLHRAPDAADGIQNHSVCGVTRAEGGAVDHREYVVYKEQQALPLFAVRYRHHNSCLCAICSR